MKYKAKILGAYNPGVWALHNMEEGTPGDPGTVKETKFCKKTLANRIKQHLNGLFENKCALNSYSTVNEYKYCIVPNRRACLNKCAP